MAVVKVIEIMAESTVSWEDATKDALAEAAKTIKNIQSIYVDSMQAVVEDNKIARYRVATKISFIVRD
jgi:flavin-binding protein dodecin